MARINKKIFQNLIKNHVVACNFTYTGKNDNTPTKELIKYFVKKPQIYFTQFSKKDGVEVIEFSNEYCEIFQKIPSVNNIYHLFEYNNHLYAVRETRYKTGYCTLINRHYTIYKLYPKLFVRDI